METNEVVARSFNLLKEILNASPAMKNDDDLQLSFVYRHTSNILQLGNDVVFLLESGRPRSCPIIVRVMLESLFKLVAAFNNGTNAVQIIVWELKDDSDRMRKWLDPKSWTSIAADLSKQADHLRQEYSITENKKWKAFACAEASELEGSYREAYFHLSSHTHATVTGISIQETTPSTGYVLQTMLFVVLSAALRAAHAFPTKSQQADLDECRLLGDEWMRLMDNGVFAKMDAP